MLKVKNRNTIYLSIVNFEQVNAGWVEGNFRFHVKYHLVDYDSNEVQQSCERLPSFDKTITSSHYSGVYIYNILGLKRLCLNFFLIIQKIRYSLPI